MTYINSTWAEVYSKHIWYQRRTESTFCRFLLQNAKRLLFGKEDRKATTIDIDMLKSTAITFIIIYALEALFMIIGNSFTMFVFWKQRLHQKRTCLLLINLAVADLLVGISEVILLCTGKFDKMTAIPGKEKKASFLSALPLLASSLSLFFLALVALERVYAVLWPLRHRATNTRVYICGIVIVWAVGLFTAGLSLLPMYYSKVERRYVAVSIHVCLFMALLVICASYRLRYVIDYEAHQLK